MQAYIYAQSIKVANAPLISIGQGSCNTDVVMMDYNQSYQYAMQSANLAVYVVYHFDN